MAGAAGPLPPGLQALNDHPEALIQGGGQDPNPGGLPVPQPAPQNGYTPAHQVRRVPVGLFLCTYRCDNAFAILGRRLPCFMFGLMDWTGARLSAHDYPATGGDTGTTDGLVCCAAGPAIIDASPLHSPWCSATDSGANAERLR